MAVAASGRKPSQGALAEVLEAIGDAVYAMDRRERILFANRRALELWGKRADEVVGRRLLDAFPGIEEGEPYRAYRTALTSGERAHIETVAPALAGRWIELDVHPAPNGGLVVVFRDIDARKRSEAALRQSEERFRSMLEALPLMAYVFDTNGDALYYNRQFYDYVGLAVGRSARERTAILHVDDRAVLDEARRQGFATAKEYTVEARIRRHDGVHRWHRIHNRPMRVEERLVLWLGTAVDIDEIRRATEVLEERVAGRTAELQAANRRLAAQIEERERAEDQLRQALRIEALGKLTAGIAHDFNNLLTAIIGNIELLESCLGALDERAARLLAAALSAAERGASLTGQLLAFARQQRMNPKPVDLNRTVAGMAALMQSTIGPTIRVEVTPGKDLWPALADVAQIELVLLNLAINARDAMGSGGTITITTGNVSLGAPQRPEEPSPGDYVMVSVADGGGGIPSSILDKVFDPFFTTKEVGKGSGLGLSQVLGVAQQLGGGVRIETEEGVGTVVKVFLLRADAPQTRTAHAAAVNGVSPIQPSAIVLLVDDDDDVRAVTAAMLRDAGNTVIEAGSGGAALERLDGHDPPIELMIADLAMPGMNGIELARAARQLRPDLPIFFVSGYADSVPRDQLMPGELLQKPFRAAALAAKVTEALTRRSRRSEATPRASAPPPGAR